MPLLFLETPAGLDGDRKRALIRQLTTVIDATYRFPDTRVFIREYDEENVGQDGEVGGPVRPVAFLEAPELVSTDRKRELVAAIHAAVAQHYHGVADVEQTLVLINQYPLTNVGWLAQLQSDNAMIVSAVDELNAPPAVEQNEPHSSRSRR